MCAREGGRSAGTGGWREGGGVRGGWGVEIEISKKDDVPELIVVRRSTFTVVEVEPFTPSCAKPFVLCVIPANRPEASV